MLISAVYLVSGASEIQLAFTCTYIATKHRVVKHPIIHTYSMENIKVTITRAMDLNFWHIISIYMYLHHNKAQSCSASDIIFINFAGLPQYAHTGRT